MFSEETMLGHHLQYNHYPPIATVFVETARRAIQLVDEECWDEEIVMPNGVTLLAREIVEQLHLHDFLAPDGP